MSLREPEPDVAGGKSGARFTASYSQPTYATAYAPPEPDFEHQSTIYRSPARFLIRNRIRSSNRICPTTSRTRHEFVSWAAADAAQSDASF
jgi:hypothetical protein